MWNKFLDRMLKLWIAIPNSLKSGVVHLILIVFFFIYLVNGVEFVIEFFNGSSSFKASDFIISMVLAFILFWCIKNVTKYKKEK
ncbi:hypothetical protein ERICIV_03765 [Paenibacillus larvae subsp. larvae]|uniref:Uncharacterized protein n=2 Tax=Paenibacillus larvae TaxID=1464 RepID=A0A2L1U588_9BACL|nr:hypothetical protein B1222_08485 [Paenibacillus larvae subsp. pulvifaciens]AQZ46415.1 hypothetical protein B5S25_07060 [Paenibacillus larvae subsp. pulvifaciens]AVF28105.1 hypothetical protein ERICIII_04022 [Paenibacillus larvae subsp. larvae]AVF32608.1 hypothetical protein ERICIV_03765 [Paenibacillus larvae subsp. larvae]MBH0343878.1 hypothetical protein [Paenibacillus larvae]